MKIGLVILHGDPSRGGAERYTVDLAAALGRRGLDARIIATSFSDEVLTASRVEIPANAITRAGRYRAFLAGLEQHFAQNSYDVIHAMLPIPRCDIYHPHAGMMAEQLSKLSIVFNPRRRRMAEVERELLTGAQPPIVLCLSEYSKADVTKHYTLPPDRLVTLFNGVDLDRFQPSHAARAQVLESLRLRPDSIIALIVANDWARKGVTEAMRAMPLVGDPRLALIVVGSGDTTFYSREAIKFHANVIFAGKVKDTKPFYEAADFFIMPTKHDPCSLVALEALAMGVPVISTKCNGATEVMTDGVHGYVLDNPRDLPGIVEAMKKMLDADRRAAMAQACLELRPRLSFEHHLDRLEAIYLPRYAP
jgi:UDP-glucose:(heptosyl)LPS alpha-1,3-glucosyltransferase